MADEPMHPFDRTPFDAFLRAVHHPDGDLAKAKRLAEKHPELVQYQTWDDGTALTWAAYAEECKLEGVRYLLDLGSEVDHVNQEGFTAIHLAAARGHVAVVRLLLERGADPTIPDKGAAMNPLIQASRKGNTELVRVLLADGRVIDTINHRTRHGDETALWHACLPGYDDIVALLLEKGADPTIECKGQTPMAMLQSPTYPWGQKVWPEEVEGRKKCLDLLKVSHWVASLAPVSLRAPGL
jgi:ankyrin repeat protein